MVTDYCTLEEVREHGKFKTADIGDDTLLGNLIDRVSQLLNNKCGRVLVPDADTSHYFTLEADVDGYDLNLDETLLSVTTLTNANGNTIASSEYFLLPRAYERKSVIRLKEASTVSWEDDTDGYIEVDGRWGYTATVPVDLRQAAIETVLFTYHKRGDNLKIAERPQQSNDGTRYTPIAWTQFAKEVIEHYRKRV